MTNDAIQVNDLEVFSHTTILHHLAHLSFFCWWRVFQLWIRINNANQELKAKESTSDSSKDKSNQTSRRTNFGSPLDVGFFDNPVIKRFYRLFDA
jgi:hypothetical protein